MTAHPTSSIRILLGIAAFLVLIHNGRVRASTAHPPAPAPPNVVLILTDDLGVHDLACYGRTEHNTPNLDRLAADGMRFTSAYCAQPICSPSRAALLTGRSPARLHLTTYLPGRPDCPAQPLRHPRIRQELALNERTLAERLRDVGYATACIGKWHLGGVGAGPAEQGFDLVHTGQAVTRPSEIEGSKGEYDLTSAAMKFIAGHPTQPFFLFLSHNSPHIPYSSDSTRVARNRSAFEPEYAAVVETLDDAVGRLLVQLDGLGMRDRTIVIFTSDNGGLHVPELQHRRVTHNGPFRAGKGYLYEGGLRIPLIVRWPGRIPAGRVVDTPVVNTAWAPTILELCGLDRGIEANAFDAVSFARLLSGGENREPSPLYWHFPHYTNQGGQPAGAMRDGRWKLIEHYEDGRCELFDLGRDPSESTDLASRETRRVRRMRAALADWRQRMNAQTNTPNPSFDRPQYRQLYTDFVPSRFAPATADAAGWTAVHRWREAMDSAIAVGTQSPKSSKPE